MIFITNQTIILLINNRITLTIYIIYILKFKKNNKHNLSNLIERCNRQESSKQKS